VESGLHDVARFGARVSFNAIIVPIENPVNSSDGLVRGHFGIFSSS
jgi:hypothetical protein